MWLWAEAGCWQDELGDSWFDTDSVLWQEDFPYRLQTTLAILGNGNFWTIKTLHANLLWEGGCSWVNLVAIKYRSLWLWGKMRDDLATLKRWWKRGLIFPGQSLLSSFFFKWKTLKVSAPEQIIKLLFSLRVRGPILFKLLGFMLLPYGKGSGLNPSMTER